MAALPTVVVVLKLDEEISRRVRVLEQKMDAATELSNYYLVSIGCPCDDFINTLAPTCCAVDRYE